MTSLLTPLDRTELSAEGLDGYAYGYRDRVRFYEIDALNHVNNVVFLRWFETVRVAYVQDYGFSNYNNDIDPMLVVRRVTADYLAPVFQNEVYTIGARTTLIKSSSFFMEYALAAGGQIRATGEAVVISLEQDGKTRRAHYETARKKVVDQDGAKTAD